MTSHDLKFVFYSGFYGAFDLPNKIRISRNALGKYTNITVY